MIAPAADGPLLVQNPTGTSWLATAGTGDVLAGLAWPHCSPRALP